MISVFYNIFQNKALLATYLKRPHHHDAPDEQWCAQPRSEVCHPGGVHMVSVHSVTKMALLCLLFGVENVVSAPAADLVDVLPQFNRTSFKVIYSLLLCALFALCVPRLNFVCAQVYSGYLSVPGPFKGNKYDSLSIHYQFEEAQSDAAKAPVVTWHQVGLSCQRIVFALHPRSVEYIHAIGWPRRLVN